MNTGPQRIQRRRTPGWTAPANTIYVGRGTRWGNPWRVENGMSPHGAVWRYRDATNGRLPFANVPTPNEIRAALAGKNLMCWCAPGSPCHADVLLEIANQDQP